MRPIPSVFQPGSRRRAGRTLVLAAATLPLVLYGVYGAMGSHSNDPRQWLPRGFQETELYRQFQDQFGRDEITVVTWEGCTIEDPRVEELARAVLDQPGGVYERAITGPRLLRQMTGEPSRIPLSEANRRLRGTLIGPDGRTTCVIFILSKAGVENRSAAIEGLLAVAEKVTGLPPEQIRLAGPTVDAATIDIESRRMLTELSIASAVIAFLLTWWRIGNLWLASVVLATSIYSTGLALAVLFYSGGNMNLLMTMLPALIYVVSISSSVHLVNYYRDAVAEEGLQTAPRLAVRHGWAPCVLAALTTSVGLGSLMTSAIVPIYQFGAYSAIGVALSIAVQLLLVPAMLTLWPARGLAAEPRAARAAEDRPQSGLVRVTALICRYHWPLTAAGLIVMAALGGGLARLKSTVKLQHRFAEKSKIIGDYRWMEEHLGPLIPLEIVVGFDASTALGFFEQMETVAGLERRLAELDDVGATMSAATFAPPLPGGGSIRDAGRRAVMASRIEHARQQFIDGGFVAQIDGQQRWRISVRVDALSDVDYAHFTNNLREHVDPILASMPEAAASATYTGVIPLIYKAQRQLFNDLLKSFLLAFGVIALVMIAALRSPLAGLSAMAPNLFPIIIIFGYMGWRGILIEIGSVMTASAALGIAVDDTFHFLTWFRRGVGEGKKRRRSLRFAYQRCAAAMLATTLICSCGLAVFAVSDFMPIAHFAWMMVALLAAAVVGDLVFLPAMLAGPWGNVFTRNRPSERSRQRGAGALT